jgi:hypothetical protein
MLAARFRREEDPAAGQRSPSFAAVVETGAIAAGIKEEDVSVALALHGAMNDPGHCENERCFSGWSYQQGEHTESA